MRIRTGIQINGARAPVVAVYLPVQINKVYRVRVEKVQTVDIVAAARSDKSLIALTRSNRK